VKKKLILGIVLVVTILLLMPSISAIQKEKIVESFEGKIKFPILNGIICFLLILRLVRACALLSISSNGTDDGGRGPPDIEILHPILYFRGMWLAMKLNLLAISSQILSDALGLNWIFPIELFNKISSLFH
jgi:hypothetical protein